MAKITVEQIKRLAHKANQWADLACEVLISATANAVACLLIFFLSMVFFWYWDAVPVARWPLGLMLGLCLWMAFWDKWHKHKAKEKEGQMNNKTLLILAVGTFVMSVLVFLGRISDELHALRIVLLGFAQRWEERHEDHL